MNAVVTPTSRYQVRGAAAAGIVGGLLQVSGGIVWSVDRKLPGEPDFVLHTSMIGIAYVMLMVTVIGLTRSGAAGQARSARIGLGAAGLGWLLAAVAQFVLQVDFELAVKVLFPVSSVLNGLGMIMAGIGVFRVHAWRGWRRVITLICGLYPFLVIFPVFAASGGPNFLVLSGHGLCWALLGVALWTSAPTGGVFQEER